MDGTETFRLTRHQRTGDDVFDHTVFMMCVDDIIDAVVDAAVDAIR